MAIQILSLPVLIASLQTQKQDLVLERADLASRPLGAVGNLQFKAEPAGMRRAGGALLSGVRCLLAGLRANLAFFLTLPFAQARAQRNALVMARDNSRRIGNLLGSLTAPVEDAKAHVRAAQRLADLGRRAQGDLNTLCGGRYCLSTYMDELDDSAIKALRCGVLGSLEARLAVLNQISPEKLRIQASHVLSQIVAHLDQRLAKDCARDALWQLAEQLSAAPIDGQTLKGLLTQLSADVKASGAASAELSDGYELARLLQSLPKEQSKALLIQLRSGALEPGRQALSRLEDSPERQQAIAMLDHIRGSLAAVDMHASDRRRAN